MRQPAAPQTAVLRERQLQSHGQDHCSIAQDSLKPAHDVGQHALAKLRLRRSEQRKTSSTVGTAPRPAGAQQHSNDGHTSTDVSAHPPSRRLRAQVVTTAGRGMQRQAPSRGSSVRGSLELPQQQQQQQLVPVQLQLKPHVIGAVAAAVNNSAVPGKSSSGALTGPQLAACGTACGRRTSTTSPAQTTQRQGANTSSSNSSSVPGPAAWPQAISTSMAIRPRQSQAVMRAGAQGADVSQLDDCMGCGVPWQQLREAVAGAKAGLQRQPGAQLQQRRQTQQHRQRIAQLVVLQWRYYSSSQARLRAAHALYTRRLMAAAWQALAAEVHRMLLLAGRANLHATKHAFALLSRAFSSWHQQVVLRKRLELVVDTLQAHKQRQLSAAVLLGWREWVQHKRRQRQLLLRAEACHMFVTMLRTLQHWRARTTDKQLARLQAARADQQWQQTVYRHVLRSWSDKAARGAAKWQALATALCFHKQHLLTRALQAWALAVQQQQEARAAAERALGAVAQALQLQSAAAVLVDWHQAAQLQVQHTQLLEAAAARRQQRTQQQVLQQWHQLVLYHQQLAEASAVLQQLEPRLWLAHSFKRWRGVAQVLAGQRSDELRELVQLRACLGTWLSWTDRRRHKAMRLLAAKATLARLQLSRLLPVWAEVTAQQLCKQQAQEVAQQHYQAQLLRRMLLVWQMHAAEAVVERLQETAAAELHRLRLLAAGLRGLLWYSRHRRLKAAAPDHYQHKLLARVLAAWRARTAYKQHAEQQRRVAVRHHYLSTLHKGLQAWQQLLAAAVQKRQLMASAKQHYERRVLGAAFKAWRGPVLQWLQHKHQQQAAADTLARRHLLRRCLCAWTAAVAARHAKQAQLAAALQLRQHSLLGKGWQGFLLVQQQARQEEQALAAAAAPVLVVLNRLKQRWVLKAWLAAARQQQQEQQLGQLAAAHARRCRLGRCLGVWQVYLARRRHKAVQAGRAAAHRSRGLQAAGVSALRQRVSRASGKRQRVFSAALHRRGWLLWRAFRAWRLETSVSHLQRIVTHPSALHTAAAMRHSSSSSSSSQVTAPPDLPLQLQQGTQRGGTELAVVAATVVEASCAGHEEWQQRWRSKWEQLVTVQQQPQQQAAWGQSDQHGMLQASQTLAAAVLMLPPVSSNPASPSSTPVMQQLADKSVCSADAEGSSIAGSVGGSAKRAARRPPRLPSFMQAGLLPPPQPARQLEHTAHQQLPLLLGTHGSAHEQQQQQRQRQEASCFDGDVLPQPPVPGMCSSSLAPTQQPSQALSRRVRQQPRQLRPSLLDPAGTQQQQDWRAPGLQGVALQQQGLTQVLIVNPETNAGSEQQQPLAGGLWEGVVLD